MKKFLVAAGVLLAATTASAGVRIETITRDIKTLVADGGPSIVLVQDGKIRMNNPKNSNTVILKNEILYVIDDQRKSYSEMDKATLQKAADQAGGALKEMQERMKNMPPEQRAQMEKMMGSKVHGMMSGKTDVYEARDTGRSDSSEGRKCRVWELMKNGKLDEELCVVPFSSMPGKEDMQRTFKELAESFQGLTNSIPGAGEAAKVRSSINGYPVRTRHFDDAGALRGTETVLTKWVEESMPAATFEVPAGYKKKELPKMMGG